MVKAFAHGRSVYWYALLLPLLLLPWFFWLPAWRGWTKNSLDGATRFCLCAVLPAFFLLSCVSGKQIHYVLPLLPVVSLLIAHAVTTIPKRTQFDHLPLLLIFLLLSLALVVVPQIPLHGDDREMLRYIPKWLAVVPFSAAVLLFLFRADSMLKSIKIVSITMLLLVILLHLALAAPLHAIYNQKVIGDKINQVQKQNQPVAVFPPGLTDQFQFAGRLQTPLISLHSMANLAAWAAVYPEGSCLIFTKSDTYEQLKGPGTARPYSNGWLIFRSAKDFAADYKQWLTQPAD